MYARTLALLAFLAQAAGLAAAAQDGGWTDEQISACLKRPTLQATDCWPKFRVSTRYEKLPSAGSPYDSVSEDFKKNVLELCNILRGDRSSKNYAVVSSGTAVFNAEFLARVTPWNWDDAGTYMRSVAKRLTNNCYDQEKILYEFADMVRSYEEYRFNRLGQYSSNLRSRQRVPYDYLENGSSKIGVMTILGRNPLASLACFFEPETGEFKKSIYDGIPSNELPEPLRELRLKEKGLDTGQFVREGSLWKFVNSERPVSSERCGALIGRVSDLMKVSSLIESSKQISTWMYVGTVLPYSLYETALKRQQDEDMRDRERRREQQSQVSRMPVPQPAPPSFMSGSQKRTILLIMLAGLTDSLTSDSAQSCSERIKEFEYNSSDYSRRAIVNACGRAVTSICNDRLANEGLCREGRLTVGQLGQIMGCTRGNGWLMPDC